MFGHGIRTHEETGRAAGRPDCVRTGAAVAERRCLNYPRSKSFVAAFSTGPPDRVIRDVQVLHPGQCAATARAVGLRGNQLRGQALTRVLRRGKFLWWPLADGVTPDRASGHVGPVPRGCRSGEHTRVILDLDRTRLLFDDQRTFGGLWLDEIVGGLPLSLGHIAADRSRAIYDRAATVRTIRSRRARSVPVARSGSCFRDRQHLCRRGPVAGAGLLAHPGCDLSAKVGQLLDAAIVGHDPAIAAGGTSFDALYVNVSGGSGYFQRDLAAITDRKACPVCAVGLRSCVSRSRTGPRTAVALSAVSACSLTSVDSLCQPDIWARVPCSTSHNISGGLAGVSRRGRWAPCMED